MGHAFTSDCRIGIMQKRRLEAQEGDDLRPDSGLHSPSAPVHEVGFEIEMDEPVPQRPRHREVHSAVGGRIARRDDHPPIGQLVLAQLSVEDQLVAAGLGHLRRRSQFIEKENALSVDRQEPGRNPFGAVRRNARQAPQIDRIELHGPDVEKLPLEIGSDLGNNL